MLCICVLLWLFKNMFESIAASCNKYFFLIKISFTNKIFHLRLSYFSPRQFRSVLSRSAKDLSPVHQKQKREKENSHS
ncbi:hypothetical protein PUN28_001606 [Cardiocondyla obscurior]|uniref:Secreted protein n=1 Tax=Cardiocondyla obscurior TaxID=286306 RepID=A0AAW2GQC7_9HYME